MGPEHFPAFSIEHVPTSSPLPGSHSEPKHRDSFMCSGVSNVVLFSGNKVQSLVDASDVLRCIWLFLFFFFISAPAVWERLCFTVRNPIRVIKAERYIFTRQQRCFFSSKMNNITSQTSIWMHQSLHWCHSHPGYSPLNTTNTESSEWPIQQPWPHPPTLLYLLFGRLHKRSASWSDTRKGNYSIILRGIGPLSSLPSRCVMHLYVNGSNLVMVMMRER